MKNLYLIPTDKPSRLHKDPNSSFLILTNQDFVKSTKNALHLYITSDEEIKEGDWVFYTLALGFCKTTVGSNGLEQEGIPAKKIILTTDQDLIKDGVQFIDDEFLRWFVNNPSCEWVEIERIYIMDSIQPKNLIEYKIIIPKEEPKQETFTYTEASKKEERIFNSTMMSKQETLEESFDGIYNSVDFTEFDFASFKLGAKWQQEQILQFLYSEITERRPYSSSKMCEEVIKFIQKLK
jgi:hypothetical protein